MAIEDIVVNQGAKVPAGTNLRVNVHNPGTYHETGPSTVTLYVRGNAAEPWRVVQSWNHSNGLRAGYRQSHDYFASVEGQMDPAFYQDDFLVRAVVVSGGKEAATEVIAR
ncbi:MAG: hypothetical protein HY319_09580 [Armatimonadetes bacterium]|nr:hypothetical protein [Armatimonadota bacterium]